jgi:F0F1-type ATP synthase assembly protein I
MDTLLLFQMQFLKIMLSVSILQAGRSQLRGGRAIFLPIVHQYLMFLKLEKALSLSQLVDESER